MKSNVEKKNGYMNKYGVYIYDSKPSLTASPQEHQFFRQMKEAKFPSDFFEAKKKFNVESSEENPSESVAINVIT
jgi:hypothetical protein